uniref:Retrotransposon gag domain-containing protein n=1 Tax=Tanacetum cinerariifolium TaxID=118510 RepID=A0A6L2MR79_TANCI|nr:hypothetical protein [Tanacetum cinerariifolium]
MGDANLIRTLGDYSKHSHEGYRNTIELTVGNNVDFLKLVDSLDLDSENRERTRVCLFQVFLRDQASNWLEHLPAGSITTWEDLTTRFLAQFFPPGRTTKLYNDILMFQKHQGDSLSEAWTRFKNLLQNVPHHGIGVYCYLVEIIAINLDTSSDNSSSESDNNTSDSASTSQNSNSKEIDYDSPEYKRPPKSLLKWYGYLSDKYKDKDSCKQAFATCKQAFAAFKQAFAAFKQAFTCRKQAFASCKQAFTG